MVGCVCSKYGGKYFWLGTEITSRPAPVSNNRPKLQALAHSTNWNPLQAIAGHDSPESKYCWLVAVLIRGAGIPMRSSAHHWPKLLEVEAVKSWLGALCDPNSATWGQR